MPGNPTKEDRFAPVPIHPRATEAHTLEAVDVEVLADAAADTAPARGVHPDRTQLLHRRQRLSRGVGGGGGAAGAAMKEGTSVTPEPPHARAGTGKKNTTLRIVGVAEGSTGM